MMNAGAGAQEEGAFADKKECLGISETASAGFVDDKEDLRGDALDGKEDEADLLFMFKMQVRTRKPKEENPFGR